MLRPRAAVSPTSPASSVAGLMQAVVAYFGAMDKPNRRLVWLIKIEADRRLDI